MPTTYQRCDESVLEIAKELWREFETYEPMTDAGVKIDFVFAFAEKDDNGNVLGDALKHHGCKALGICKKLSLKDRALGRGDAEISIDGDWWQNASHDERRALLDHEMYHIKVTSQRDDLGRPVIKMREHDYEFGWFSCIAARHGLFSQERIQAAKMMDQAGQFFWPSFCGGDDHSTVTIKTDGKSPVTVPFSTFTKVANQLKK